MRKEVVIARPDKNELGLRVFEDPVQFDGIIISTFDEKLSTEERCYIKRTEIQKFIEVLKEWYE